MKDKLNVKKRIEHAKINILINWVKNNDGFGVKRDKLMSFGKGVESKYIIKKAIASLRKEKTIYKNRGWYVIPELKKHLEIIGL